jgi:hypothetical protein
MTKDELAWSHREGRDAQGDKFSQEILLHASGRILARIFIPLGDEFNFRVAFYVFVPDTVLAKPDDFHDFIDLDSAQRFAEETLLAYDPLAPPAKADKAGAAKERTPAEVT